MKIIIIALIAVCMLIAFTMYACCVASSMADKRFPAKENDDKCLNSLIFLQE